MSKVDDWLLLNPGEFRSLLPFSALYFFLFSILTLADGLSTALFLSRLGPEYISQVYILSAVLNFFIVGIYVRIVDLIASTRILLLILFSLILSYLPLSWLMNSSNTAVLLYPYALREVFYTLILIHFGNFIADYFTREQLVRVLPLSYSGGRLGGLLGAFFLSTLPLYTPLETICYVIAVFGVFCLWCLQIIRKQSSPLVVMANRQDVSSGLLPQIRINPYLRYLIVMSFSFMLLRWITQYLHINATHEFYRDKQSIALFIGRYTFVSVSIAFLFQLLIFNRLVRAVGLRVSHTFYNILLVSCPVFALLFFGQYWNLIWMRFIENELRFSLRNPLSQLFVNNLGYSLRRRTRAITMGLINPIGVFSASAVIWICQDDIKTVALAGILCGLLHLGITHLFHRSRDPKNA